MEDDVTVVIQQVRRTKVNLKRLLSRLESQLVAGSGKIPDAEQARFETFVGVARGYLDELNEARLLLDDGSGADTAINSVIPSEEELAEFGRKTQYLADLFADRTIVERAAHVRGTAAEAQLRRRVKSRLVTERRTELLGDVQDASPNREANEQETVKAQRREQEDLTEDMLALAADLKESTSLMERIARDDHGTLEGTSQRATNNLGLISTEVSRVMNYSDQMFKSTWLYWCLLFFVCVIFILAYLVIKITPSSRA